MELNHQPLKTQSYQSLHTVTPLSKYLAFGLFIIVPFLGGFVGYVSAPERVVYVSQVAPAVPVDRSHTERDQNQDLPPLVDGLYDTGIATTTVDMVAYSIQYTDDQIQLLKGVEVMQTIPWETEYFQKVFTHQTSYLITNYDLNFDHYLDLGVLTGVGYGGVNRFYQFYTFNPETYRLERMTEFDTFEPDLSNVINPSLNIKNRSLVSSMKTAQQWDYVEYQFDGNRYQKVREWSEGWEIDLLWEAMKDPAARLESCPPEGAMFCFGSGRIAQPHLDTKDYAVYLLVSKVEEVRYGIVHKVSGESYTFTVPSLPPR